MSLIALYSDQFERHHVYCPDAGTQSIGAARRDEKS